MASFHMLYVHQVKACFTQGSVHTAPMCAVQTEMLSSVFSSMQHRDTTHGAFLVAAGNLLRHQHLQLFSHSTQKVQERWRKKIRTRKSELGSETLCCGSLCWHTEVHFGLHLPAGAAVHQMQQVILAWRSFSSPPIALQRKYAGLAPWSTGLPYR